LNEEGVRAIAQDSERWRALCKHSTITSRRGLTKGSEEGYKL